MKEKYPGMGISFALCDCVAGKRKIVDNEVWIEAEKKATIYALEYEGVNFSYGIPEGMSKCSSKEKISIMSKRKASNLNLPHALMSYLHLYHIVGSLEYEAVKEFADEPVYKAFEIFNSKYADLFALNFIMQTADENACDAKALFESTKLYCQDNVKRFRENHKDAVGRVVHLKSESEYREKMNKIRCQTSDMIQVVHSPETEAFIIRNDLDIELDRCRDILKTFNEALDSAGYSKH